MSANYYGDNAQVNPYDIITASMEVDNRACKHKHQHSQTRGMLQLHFTYHDAADASDADAVIGLEEGAGADLQRDGGHKAADDLRGLVRNRHRVHREHHNVDHEEACKFEQQRNKT